VDGTGTSPRRAARAVAGALLVVLLVAGLPVGVGAPAAEAASGELEVVGRGWGHGRGLGQYGALGYAVDAGWGSGRILDHYYGGTVAGNVGNPAISVELRAHTGVPVAVAATRGVRTSADDGLPGGRVPRAALRVQRVGPGRWQVADGPGCNGPWTPRPVLTAAPEVAFLPPAGGSDDRADMLQVCEPGRTRWYRGSLRLVDTGGTSSLVNHLRMEQYLRGVVPRESPASWADLGGGRGLQALAAQSVAARSYAAAEGRAPWAKTCDTTSCQVYGGAALQVAGQGVTSLEDRRSDLAVQATAGTVRMRGGAVARTEFSSSTGGWTAGGTFPAVPDDGDAYAGNPNHRWRTRIPVEQVEGTYRRGALLGIEVTERNGLGPDGGRVRSVRVRLTGGTVSVSGDEFRRAFGLRSDWFTVTEAGPRDDKVEPAGGYRLDPDGRLTPFGAAAPATGDTSTPAGRARAVALGGRANRVGYVLDGFGGLHPFNGARAVDGPSWPGWDIARDVVVRADGRSGYVLDGLGGVHPFGGAPGVATPGFDPTADRARRLALRADGASGYVVAVNGSVAPFGAAPVVRSSPLPPGRAAVGLVLAPDGTSGHVVDDAGTWHPFGAGPLPAAVSSGLPGTAAVDGRPDGRSGYLVSATGVLAAVGAARSPSPPPARPTRDLALLSEPSGYVLDGFGGLAAFGGAPAAMPSGYWPGDDVARRVVLRPDGAGYVLDAYGALHPFGTEATPAPPRPSGGPSWPGWPVARDVALLPGDGDAGYVLDAFGGIHPFGGAPPVRANGYWPGADVARRLVLAPGGRGGYVLDRTGGLKRFAVDDAPMPPGLRGTPSWPGQDRARDVVLTGATAGYVLDDRGAMTGFGGATGRGSWRSEGRPAAVGAGLGIRAWLVYADDEGGLHTAPEAAPAASPSSRWPGWPIARDIAVLR
jgi:SpoIID/LytB domain protein